MARVKICGITNLEDAQASIEAGCDALGFVFYKKTPRYISPQKAKEIIRSLPKNVIKIGVFVNAKEKNIRRVAKSCQLDMLQFHGNESPEFCDRFKDYKVIKAFRIRSKGDLRKVLGYKTFAFLFDTFAKTKMGGSGKKFDWKLIKGLDSFKCQIFLSGGLTDSNVQEGIEVVQPDWVDVSSGVENTPGKKDYKKVKKFIATAKKG